MPEGQISVISVPVSDMDLARRFYTDVMGFEVVADDMSSPDQRWITLRPVGGSTAITLVTWFKEMAPGSLRGLILSVANISKAIEDLRSRGVNLIPDGIQKAPWGHWVSIEDPDGNGWIIQQDVLLEATPEEVESP